MTNEPPAKILDGLLATLDRISDDDFEQRLRLALTGMNPEQVRKLKELCRTLA